MSSSTFKVGVVYDPIMGEHHNDGDGFHYERPERIYSIYQSLVTSGLISSLVSIKSREATRTELELAHVPEYVNKIIELLSRPNTNDRIPDSDMYANEHTLKAALTAAGSTLQLTQDIMENKIESGFAIVRPPGHHATPGKCMGFCYFHNLGIAAIHAAKNGRRVLIVDFDVHHGNGTEKLIRKHKELRNLLFFSIHRWDDGEFYPGTGKPIETERVINVGFNGSRGDGFYLSMFKNRLLPRAKGFAPDLILVSAGFDAAEGDPLGQCTVTPDGYYQMIQILQSICPNIALVLEGGYNLQSISQSSLACTQALLKVPLQIM